jgi:2-keto-4-pentenoate hydratase/2-oxohepta-3-ene-1,7-dioic acid hydratase in catechol pathway
MKIICVGRNYREHASELGNSVPEDPILFMKPKSALLLPDKDLYYPEFTQDLHYEIELVIKISKNGKYIAEKFSRRYYDEVTVGIDFTARDLQQKQKSKGLPWEIAKAFDGSAVVGSFVPLAQDENMDHLRFSLARNGTIVQDGFTGDMMFKIGTIIEYASQFFTLNIGDLLFTGTPKGVGAVQINDRLEGFLGGEKLLDLTIK